MDNQRHVDICFSPALYENYMRANNLVVVIDLFRATTVMVTALHNGASSIIPVADIDEAASFRNKGYLIAGERNGDPISSFDFGNSPLEFTEDKVNGKKIAMSTTNGTQAFAASKKEEAIAGSVLNYSAVISHILHSQKDVLFLCSGWTMKMNIEDTLLSGAFASDLLKKPGFYSESDSIAIANELCEKAGEDWIKYILSASPRLKGKYEILKKDMEWAMQKDFTKVVPELIDNELIIS